MSMPAVTPYGSSGTATAGRLPCFTPRGFRSDFGPAPDFVAHPRDESEVIAVLEWAGGEAEVVLDVGED